MGFLKNHVEKFLFILIAVFLGLSVVMVAAKRANLPGEDSLRIAVPPPPEVEETDRFEMALARVSGEAPPLEIMNSVFTPPVRRVSPNPDFPALIPVDAEFCPFTGEELDPDTTGFATHPPIPDELKRVWGLSVDDPNAHYEILDGSGFTVLHQWERGHDPTDPDDIPPLIDYLRLTDMEETSVEFLLRGTAQPAPNVWNLQLRWRYPDSDRWDSGFIRVGNTFGRDDEFLAESFNENRVFRDNIYVDESDAVIRGGRHTLRLRRRERGAISERTATLGLYMGPEWSAELRWGETFELDNKTYKVVDIREGAVVIQAEDEDRELTIRAATEGEIEEASPPESDLTEDGAPGMLPDEMVFDPELLNF